MKMKQVQCTLHAIQEIARRKLDIQLVERAVRSPDLISLVEMGRWAYVRQFHDVSSGKAFVIRAIVEQTDSGLTVVTAYRTSRIRRYVRDTDQ